MKWNDHSRDVPEGSHAFLGASTYHWLNYDEDHLIESYNKYLAKQRGTELHAFAKECVRLKQKLPNVKGDTLAMYVNDAIKYKMRPEQPLRYSSFCFGTADSISFYGNVLRIFDLKTGTIKASMKQLEIYAALFCLEYEVEPWNLEEIELRIYQNGEVNVEYPEDDLIKSIMDKIIRFDVCLQKIKEDENYG